MHNIWRHTAPANIALIKYMGKTDASSNIPTNSSLSYTLNNYLTTVELELAEHDQWQPWNEQNPFNIALTETAQQRFIKHLQFIKKQLNCPAHFIIRSTNNFPANCGIASSASSFAALTKAAVQAICELKQIPLLSIEQQARLSQQGSGSSCRSFYSPWCLWQGDNVKPVDLAYKELDHAVILVNAGTKAVSSSSAHQRVTTSLLFSNRVERAEQRLTILLDMLSQSHWKDAFQIVWEEFWDMHALFETARPSFGYMTADSMKVLQYVRDCWQQYKDGPLTTLDAGPNVHLLFRPDQQSLKTALLQYLQEHYHVI
ncbi:MAG: diphosphomevalonate decarboxylase [Gammaproteobacteria bacterium]